MRRSFNS